jgi:hypothetical protein
MSFNWAFKNLVLNCEKSLEEKEKLLTGVLEKLQQAKSQALKKDSSEVDNSRHTMSF